MWATIAFNKKDPCCFSYAVPDKWQNNVQVFQRVYVDLVESKTVGIILKLSQDSINFSKKKRNGSTQEVPLKEILKLIDKEPILNQEQLKIAEFISDYYISSLGQAIFKMIPTGKMEKIYLPETKTEHKILASKPLLKDQEKILHAIWKTQSNRNVIRQSPVTHLIFGITGSGKTRIYLELINKNLQNGMGSILLLPEIVLTYQFVEILKPYYGDKMVVLHSNIPKTERLQGYRRLQKGKALIVVGTRSAVFTPVNNLSLIILDEEHDHSYKEQASPRYHARTVAWYRLRETKKESEFPHQLILGSATPSAETYERASKKLIHLHYLKKRATTLPLPKIRLVSHNIFSDNLSLFSNLLLKKIDEHLKKNKQILLLLNRRGYSNFLFCEHCKKNIPCKQCSVNLTHHQPNLKNQLSDDTRRTPYLKCHLCGYEIEFKKNCEICGKPLSMMGKGIQKVEDAIETHFPEVQYARLDQDNARQKDYVSDILEAMRQNKIQILIGTQMIAKGFDLPNVTLVGIINADIGLSLPDFRAVERVAQLLIQASGRAGRHSLGEVIMQTMQNENPVIQKVSTYQYEEFLQQELLLRKHADFPPYSRFLRILLKGEELTALQHFCNQLESFLHLNSAQNNLFGDHTNQISVESIFGPMPASIEKIKNEYRYQLLLRDQNTQKLHKSAQLIKQYLQKSQNKGKVKYEFDMDPLDLL